MRPSHAGMHVEELRILRAEAHGASDALDSDLWLTQPDLRPSAEEPSPCPIRIEHECPFDEGIAIIEVTHNVGEGNPSGADGDSIILTQRCRTPSQPFSFGDLL